MATQVELQPTPSRLSSGNDINEKDEKRRSDSFFHEDAVRESAGVDVAVALLAGAHADDAPLTPEEAMAIRKKLDRHLLPLFFLIYCLQFMDKSVLTQASILGIIQDNHLTTDDWNNLGSAFYIGFIIFEYPHNWMLQRFPVAKYLSATVILWALFVGLNCAATNYGGLFALRLLLGGMEGSIMSGLMLVTQMFYTRIEIVERVGWTLCCNGFAQIITGFLGFGVYHINPNATPNQWQWIMIITAILTFICGIMFYLWFPDNPTTAWFLSEEEKVMAVKRVQGNQNGIETKTWKRYQFIEALTDLKTWMFFLFAVFFDLQNGVSIQFGLIIKSYGFSTLQTTLLNIPSGIALIIGILFWGAVIRHFPNSRGYLAALSFIPNILSCLLSICLPFHNRAGLLAAVYMLSLGGVPGFVISIAWVSSTNSGHTKRMTVNGIFLIGYALGQMLSTQFWKDKYKPTNHVPFAIQLGTYAVDIALLIGIREMLKRENRRRDAALAANGGVDDPWGYIERVVDGRTVQLKVEKSLLDLTDKENQSFRYVL